MKKKLTWRQISPNHWVADKNFDDRFSIIYDGIHKFYTLYNVCKEGEYSYTGGSYTGGGYKTLANAKKVAWVVFFTD